MKRNLRMYVCGFCLISVEQIIAQECNDCFQAEWLNDLPTLNGDVYAFVVYQNHLFAGGNFTCGNGSTCSDPSDPNKVYGIAQLVNDGTNWKWSSVSGGVYWSTSSGIVRALAVYGNDLIVGGDFDGIGGPLTLGYPRVANLAKWNGSWSRMHDPILGNASTAVGCGGGPGSGHSIFVLHVHGSLYIGGEFDDCTDPYEVHPNLNFEPREKYIVAYTGSGFVGLGEVGPSGGLDSYNSGGVYAMANNGQDLYVGGSFDAIGTYVGGICPPLARGIARWNSAGWSTFPGGISSANWGCLCGGRSDSRCSGEVRALHFYPEGSNCLFLGGNFNFAGEEPIPGLPKRLVHNIASVNVITGDWSEPGGGFNKQGVVNSLEVFRDSAIPAGVLYAGGHFTASLVGQVFDIDASANVLQHLARWNGSCWRPIGCGSGSGLNAAEGTASPIFALKALNCTNGLCPSDGPSLLVATERTSSTTPCGEANTPALRLGAGNDADMDGVPDSCDNCVDVFNPDQIDVDEDGIGDACDNCQCGDANDADGDGIPDSCDNCSVAANGPQLGICVLNATACTDSAECPNPLDSCEVNQENTDGDGSGDVCDIPQTKPLRLTRVQDRSGQVLETFQYQNGRLDTRTRLIGAQPILNSSYQYDAQGHLEVVTHTPSDGSAGMREQHFYYDPDFPDRVIGTLLDSSCGCASGNQFTFRDRRNRVTKLAAAATNPASAVELVRYEYMEGDELPDACGTSASDTNNDGRIDDRIKYIWRRDDHGQLVRAEERSYVENPDGTYTVRLCRRADADRWEIEKDTYTRSSRLLETCKYSEIQAACQEPSGPYDVTTYGYSRAQDQDGQLQSETWTTLYGPGYSDVTTRTITGGLNQAGSTQDIVSCRQNRTGALINVQTSHYVFSDVLGDYLLSWTDDTGANPGQARTTYLYEDTTHPERLTGQVLSAPGGLSPLPASRSSFQYDASGRMTRDYHPGPNWHGPAGCTTALEPGCVISRSVYDSAGRLTQKVDDEGGMNRLTEYRYNAFDEEIATRDAAHLVRARKYDSEGRVEYEYAYEYSGDLSSIGDASAPIGNALVYELTSYEYHPISARVQTEFPAINAVSPFSFDWPESSQISYIYDVYGQFLQEKQQFVNGDPLAEHFDYDDQGRLIQSVSPIGVVTRTVLDGQGRLKESLIQDDPINPTDSLTTTTAYRDGQVYTITSPSGAVTVNDYDDFGRLWKQRKCDNDQCDGEFNIETVFQKDDADRVIRQYTVDRAAQPQFALSDSATDYDYRGRPYRARKRIHFNETTPVNDDNLADDGQADRVQLTSYAASGDVEKVADKMGTDSTQIVELVDRVTRYENDNLGNRTKTVRVNLTASGAPFEEVTVHAFDAAGRLDSETVCVDAADCSGTTLLTDFDYDPLGRVKVATDPEGYATQSYYDARGHMVRRVRYDGTVLSTPLRQERWEYDALGRETRRIVMANAAAARDVPYDVAVDRVVWTLHNEDTSRMVRTMTYNMNLPTPHGSTMYLDGLGRPWRVEDAMGYVTKTHYEPGTGLVLYRESDDDLTGPRQVWFSYDGLGRLERTWEPAETDPTRETWFSYDGADRQISVRHKIVGSTYLETQSHFDLLGDRFEVVEGVGTAQQRTTSYGYNRVGDLTSVQATDVDPNPDQLQRTEYEYDLFGRRTKTTYPDSINQNTDAVIVTYDRTGRMKTRTDQKGQVATYTYDDRGLLLERNAGAGGAAIRDAYSYDGIGRMLSANRYEGGFPVAFGASAWTYDAFSNVLTLLQNPKGFISRLIHFQYDQAGNGLCIDCPPTGSPTFARLDYNYDAINRMSSIRRGGAALVSYDYGSALGLTRSYVKRNVTPSTPAPAVEYEVTLDRLGRTQSIVNSQRVGESSTTLASFGTSESEYDGMGNPLAVSGWGEAALYGVVTYGYDALRRVTSATYALTEQNGTETVTLDLLGNRKTYLNTRPNPDISITYGENNAANEYATGVGGGTVAYDANGNVTQNEYGFRFQYDIDNRLKVVLDPAGVQLAYYSYNALGNRYFQIKNGQVKYSFFDNQGRVFAEYEGPEESLAHFSRYYVDGPTYIDEHALLHEEGIVPGTGADYVYLLGRLNSVAGMTDSEGNVVEAYRYDAFGALHQTLAPPTVKASGSRYLSITPSPGAEPVALLVTSDPGTAAGPRLSQYVQAVVGHCVGGGAGGSTCETTVPTCYPEPGHSTCLRRAVLGPNPVYKTPQEWGNVEVCSEGIVPQTRYCARSGNEDGTLSPADCTTTWIWSKQNDSNAVVDFSDISNIVDAFKSIFIFATPQSCDLISSASCLPDGLIDFSDIASVVNSFKGIQYPCTVPIFPAYAPPPNNPYRFTGRALDFDLRAGDKGTETLTTLPARKPVLSQYNYRAREYDALNGRFNTRDPAEYVDGLNLYEYVGGQPTTRVDPSGQIPLDTLLDVSFLVYDIATRMGPATVAMDVAALLIPYVPNLRAPRIIEGVSFLATKEAKLREISRLDEEFITSLFKDNFHTARRELETENKLLTPGVKLTYEQIMGNSFERAAGMNEMRIKLEYLGRESDIARRHFTLKPMSVQDLRNLNTKGNTSKWAGHVNDTMIRGWIDQAIADQLLMNPHSKVRDLDFIWDVDPESRLRQGFAMGGLRLPKSNENRVRPIGVSEGKCTTVIRIKTELDGTVHAFPWPPKKPY